MTQLSKHKKKLSLSGIVCIASIGAGALVGVLCGGVTWLCIGSLLGLGIGFLIEQITLILLNN